MVQRIRLRKLFELVKYVSLRLMTAILRLAVFTCYMLIRLQSEEKDKL